MESHAQGASDPRAHFQNLKEVRAAVTAFVERYNTTWRLEKLGYHTPIEAREAHELAGRRSVNLCPKNWVGTRSYPLKTVGEALRLPLDFCLLTSDFCGAFFP